MNDCHAGVPDTLLHMRLIGINGHANVLPYLKKQRYAGVTITTYRNNGCGPGPLLLFRYNSLTSVPGYLSRSAFYLPKQKVQ